MALAVNDSTFGNEKSMKMEDGKKPCESSNQENWFSEGLERAHVVAELLSHEPKPQSLSDSRESVLVLEANEQKWLQPQVESWLLTKHWKGGMLLYFTELRELVPCHVDISQGAWTIHTQGATMLGFSDLCFAIDV